jgi:hypothetical protein
MAAVRRRHDGSPTRSTISGSSGQCSRLSGYQCEALVRGQLPGRRARSRPIRWPRRRPSSRCNHLVTPGEIVFLDAERAALVYILNYEAMASQPWGYAMLDNGHSKVSRETVCALIMRVRTTVRTKRRRYRSTAVSAGHDRIGKAPARRAQTVLAVTPGNLWITPRLELRIRRLGVRVPPSAPVKSRSERFLACGLFPAWWP